jgi:exopolysaccharide production protein ExoQ
VYVLFPEMFSVEAMFGMVGRNTTFTGRTALWQMGMAKIAEEPITGWGFQEYIKVAATQIKHFHSGYIELLVRGGVIALMFVIVFVFQIVFSFKRITDPKLYLFFSIMILAILAHNVTEGSFGRGVNAFWLIFSFIYFYADRMQKVPIRVANIQQASVRMVS